MKILLVSAYYPTDTSFGAGQRTSHLYKALLNVGSVDTLILREGRSASIKERPAANVLAEVEFPELPIWRKYSKSPELAVLLRGKIDLDGYDLIVGRYLGPLLALPSFRGRAIVDADDAYYRYPSGPGPVKLLSGAIRTWMRARIGKRALRRADHTWFCSERDQAYFRLRDASVLPNVVRPTSVAEDPAQATEPVVLMVGALWYGPNRSAVDRFIQRCWPRIRQQVPDARFRAIGAAPPEQRAAWMQVPGVECPGFVDDISAEYASARLSVVPVEYGGGTQIKAIESLAYARVPVVSSFVAGGFAPHLKAGDSILVADSDEEMIATVVELLRDPARAATIAASGRRVVLQQFSAERFEHSVLQAVHSLMSRGG